MKIKANPEDVKDAIVWGFLFAVVLVVAFAMFW